MERIVVVLRLGARWTVCVARRGVEGPVGAVVEGALVRGSVAGVGARGVRCRPGSGEESRGRLLSLGRLRCLRRCRGGGSVRRRLRGRSAPGRRSVAGRCGTGRCGTGRRSVAGRRLRGRRFRGGGLRSRVRRGRLPGHVWGGSGLGASGVGDEPRARCERREPPSVSKKVSATRTRPAHPASSTEFREFRQCRPCCGRDLSAGGASARARGSSRQGRPVGAAPPTPRRESGSVGPRLVPRRPSAVTPCAGSRETRTPTRLPRRHRRARGRRRRRRRASPSGCA